VQEAADGGPAEEAGLRGGDGDQTTFQVRPYNPGGDVITKIDGRPVDNPDDLSLAVALIDPGTKVPLEIWRDGERRELEVELGERPLQRLPLGG
jgi:S1-C subfamily serine protease